MPKTEGLSSKEWTPNAVLVKAKATPEIVRQEPRARVLIVGDGHQQDQFQRLIKKLGLQETVTLLGQISAEDLVLAYNSCDIFVLPSIAELEGMVVLEAMACGKPILIADSPTSASKYLVDRNGLLFKPEDPNDLAKKTLTLLSDREGLRTMAQRSLENSKRYDINQSVSRLEGLYYSVLSH